MKLEVTVYLSSDYFLPYQLYLDYDQKAWTSSCNVSMLYETKLVSPTIGWVRLLTNSTGIWVSPTGNNQAPLDIFRYVYEVQALIPKMSDFA
jgi:hypothetical protein